MPLLPLSAASGKLKIYVYDFDRAWDTPNRIGVTLKLQPFGPPLDAHGTTFASNPTYCTAVLARTASVRTTNPEEATLFFVPSPGGISPPLLDRKWCDSPARALRRHWKGSVNYFERRGGADHFTTWHREHDLRACPKWNEPPLHRVTKAVGVLSCAWDYDCARVRSLPPRPTPHGDPAVLEVPYGGSVHNSSFWQPQLRPRPLLAMAAFNTGGHLDHYRQMQLRSRLRKDCAAAGVPRCELIDLGGLYSLWHSDDGRGRLKRTLASMRRATFCLQPAGDDGARKSIIDCLTMGSIPVLFHSAQRKLWPLHWGPWRNDSHVYVPHEAVLNGSTDVFALLASITPARVAQMQSTIARHARRLVYGLPSIPLRRDAFTILTRAVLHRRAEEELERRVPANSSRPDHGPDAPSTQLHQ